MSGLNVIRIRDAILLFFGFTSFWPEFGMWTVNLTPPTAPPLFQYYKPDWTSQCKEILYIREIHVSMNVVCLSYTNVHMISQLIIVYSNEHWYIQIKLCRFFWSFKAKHWSVGFTSIYPQQLNTFRSKITGLDFMRFDRTCSRIIHCDITLLKWY